MATVDPLSSLMTSSTSSTPAATTAAGSKDEFLKLLVAQLQYQDPMSPQSNTAFVAELAQFSSLEQQTTTNSLLGNVISGQVAAQRANYANFIGKSMTAKTSKINFTPGVPPSLTAHFDSTPVNPQLVVSDASGAPVATINLTGAIAGDNPIKWDGTDGNGHPLAAGTYSVMAQSFDPGSGKQGPGSAYVGTTGVVTGLTFSTTGASFLIGPVTVSPADIITVN